MPHARTSPLLGCLLALVLLATAVAAQTTSDVGTFTARTNMGHGRVFHRTVLLNNGNVLAVAGDVDFADDPPTAEVYVPGSDSWKDTAANMPYTLKFMTATNLPDGTVLVAGGIDLNPNPEEALLYDPSTDTWTFTNNLQIVPVINHAAVFVAGVAGAGNSDGVLVTGGVSLATNEPVPNVQFYSISTKNWTALASMNIGLSSHTATVLNAGSVLVVGGFQDAGNTIASASAYIYQVGSNTWVGTGHLNIARGGHEAVLLPNGNVLVAGGYDATVANTGTVFATAELFSISTGSWSLLTSTMSSPRAAFVMLYVAQISRVMAIGGTTNITALTYDGELFPVSPALGTVDILDVETQQWSISSNNLTMPRAGHAAVIFSNGDILITGGADCYGDQCPGMTATEIFVPTQAAPSTGPGSTRFVVGAVVISVIAAAIIAFIGYFIFRRRASASSAYEQIPEKSSEAGTA